LQVTVVAPELDGDPEAAGAAAAAEAAGAAAAAGAAVLLPAEADLSIPPWPLQAPRPPCGDVVPSLQVTGLLAGVLVSCASATPGAASAAANTTLHSNVLNSTSFIRGFPL
jgi:hypothetical protein